MTSGPDFLEEAIAIGDALVASALWHDQRCTWVARQPAQGGRGGHEAAPALATLDPSVYSGTAGVALFLGRLHRASGERSHRETGLGAIRAAIRRAREVDPHQAWGELGRRGRFGWYSGTLGIGCTAAELGAEFADTTLHHQGLGLMESLRGTLRGRHEHDLLFGTASAIPPLLQVAELGDGWGAAFAEELGRDLLGHARRDNGGLSWLAPAARDGSRAELSGFSHGAAGPSWALARLYDATGDEAFREGAVSAAAWERTLYDGQRENWRDARGGVEGPGAPVGVSWCHGAPGIGAARVRSGRLLEDAGLRSDAQRAREATVALTKEALRFPGRDFSLCCGVAGLAECLWAMDDGLGADDPGRWAREVGAFGVERFGAEASRRWPGAIQWPTAAASGTVPSLMTGVAGIGLFLLRLARPSTPSATTPGLS